MRVIQQAGELKAGGKSACLAIGFFDGAHLGHQQIIRQTISDAQKCDGTSLVVTFDRHPNSVVAPDRIPPLIYSLPQRLRAIELLNADALLLIHFDETLSRQSGDAFIRALHRDLEGIHSVCVGAEFMFGHKRTGDVQLLRMLGRELQFTVHGIAAVGLNGQIVSSTRIRECILAGELDTASQMLGRPYSMAGNVIRGAETGRDLGFPTANLDVSGLALPPNGVYAAQAVCAGSHHHAVVNIGSRPTFAKDSRQIHVEVHLLDFEGDLYGQDMEVIPVGRLRDERRFSSPEELRARIRQDIADARRNWLS